MNRVVGLLWIVVIVVLSVCGRAVWQRASRVQPPTVALSELDRQTAREIQELQIQAEFGTAENWKHLAEAYLGEGFFPQAEQAFERAVSLNSADEQALYGQAFCLERMGHMKQALPIFEQLVDSTDPQLAQTCSYQIGRNLLRLENPKEAEQAFRQSIDFPPAAYQLAKLLIRTDRGEEGVTLAKQQLDNLPNSLKFIQLLAYAAERTGDRELVWQRRQQVLRAEYQLTLEYGMSYISLFRGKLGLQKQLATCLNLKNSGTLAERADCLERALALIEEQGLLNYQSVYLAAAQVALGEGRPQDALNHLEILKEQEYQTADVLELQGDVYQQIGDPEKSREFWLQAVELVPTLERHQKLSQSFAESGESEFARHHQGRSKFFRGTVAYRHNRLETAETALSESAALNPDYADTWYFLGQTQVALGRSQASRQSFERCLLLAPEHGFALEALEHLAKRHD